MVQPLWKIVWSFLRKLEFSYDPAIPFLVIYPDKTIIWKDTCTSVFIAALFTITKTWKQSKCASTDEWIKVSYIHTIDYYSAIKKNEIMPCTACNAGVPGSIPGSGRPSGKEYSTHSSILGPPWWLRWWRIHLQCRKLGFNPWVGKILWRRAWQPTPVFLSGESPWIKEPGGLQSMGSQRVKHD